MVFKTYNVYMANERLKANIKANCPEIIEQDLREQRDSLARAGELRNFVYFCGMALFGFGFDIKKLGGIFWHLGDYIDELGHRISYYSLKKWGGKK